jgi:GTPase SAR1 family protein
MSGSRDLNVDESFKQIPLGVGKTSIVNRRCFQEFNDCLLMTVGINNLSTLVVMNRKIWDTASQEQYSPLIPMFCRSTEFYLLIVDVTRDQTLDRLQKWEALLHNNGCHSPVILVVNKVDLRPSIDSEKDPALEAVFTKCQNIMFVSARTSATSSQWQGGCPRRTNSAASQKESALRWWSSTVGLQRIPKPRSNLPIPIEPIHPSVEKPMKSRE